MTNLHGLIDELHMEDLSNASHPSIFDDNEAYDMIILRLPVIGETLQFESTGFIVTKEESYLFDKTQKLFQPLEGRYDGLHRVCDKAMDALLKAFTKYQEQVATIEEALYQNNEKQNFMKEWLGLKRDILRIERSLTHASTIMDEVIDYRQNLEGFPINCYIDLHEHIDRTLRSASLQLSKLDYLYNFHTTRTNERINHSIFLLTIISAIFLPLNLMVGFFGMNTSGLPFAGGENGTLSVGILMSAVIAFMVALFYWMRKRA